MLPSNRVTLITLGVADLDRAAADAVRGFTVNAGQVCSAGTRLLVQRSIYAGFLERVAAGTYGVCERCGGPIAVERLEARLEQYPGQLTRAAVELAKDWRTDRYLRRLEAMMIVADKDVSLVLTGTGDVLEPESGVVGIGSGGNYALAAARALVDGPLDAESIVRKSLDIAADICVYTNRNVTIETLKA